MYLFEICREALLGIWVNRMRSALTITGIAIGIAAVIAVMAVGMGGQAALKAEMERSGVNYFIVTVKSLAMQTVDNREKLTLQDANLLRSNISSVEKVAPYCAEIVFGRFEDQEKQITLTGTSEDYYAVRNLALSQGRFFTRQEVVSANPVVVLDYELAVSLFGAKPALGMQVQFQGSYFQVIGVTTPRQGEGLTVTVGPSENIAYIPVTAWQRLFNMDEISQLQVKVKSEDLIDQAIREAKLLLNKNHYTKDRYETFNIGELMAMADMATGVLTTIISLVAGISLFVGGIGVMNIMLVSVTERTREVGIRMALGATRRQIMLQFLVEAVLLCLIGGLIGIVFGISGAIAIAALAHWPPLVSVQAVLVATLFSLAVGMFFGIYPANKAAKLNPIEALRYE